MRILKEALTFVVAASASCVAFQPIRQNLARAFPIPQHRETTTSSSKFLTSSLLSVKKRKSCTHSRAKDTDDDDDDDGGTFKPMADGIDSVSWLPTVIGVSGSGSEATVRKDSEILPLFPLGEIVYVPNSEHILNIFEPRYRQMYTDILMNGSKRFVVSMCHPTEQGRFAKTGVLFELEDLKEVSEQTGDQIKYICSHKVTGRVEMHNIVNPEAWESRETYLRVEGKIFDDSGKESADAEPPKDEPVPNDVYGAVARAAKENTKEEKSLLAAFSDLVNIQHELEEDVRFTKASVPSLAVKPGAGDDSLWQTIKLWQSFADQRLLARQNELQKDFQEKLQEFLRKEKGLSDEELPSAIGFGDLSPGLQQEVKELQKRMRVELKPLVLESTLAMQKILEASDHKGRLKLVEYFIESETNRLNTKKSLNDIFSGDLADSSAIPPEEQLPSVDAPASATEDSESSSTFFSDEDAFQ